MSAAEGRQLPMIQARLLRLHRTLLRTPPALLIAGLGCAALAASSNLANSFDAPRAGGPLVALALFLALTLAVALFLAATLTRLPRVSLAERYRRAVHWLIYPLLLWAALTAVTTTIGVLASGFATSLTTQHVRYGSDDLYYNHYNAILVLRGQNPYTGEHLAGEVRYFGDRAYTPLARGRFADVRHYPTRAEMDAVVDAYLAHPDVPPLELDPRTTHSYPALAFLVNLPVVALGLPSVALPQILLFVALCAAIAWAAPPPYRPLVALLLLATADGARQVAGSDFEIWPLALVALAWLARERRWTSALLLGAACATKQTAWLAAPFYLVWVWRTYGLSEASRRVAIALGAFVAVNLPWIVVSPGAWLASIFLPVSLPLLPDGSGLVALSLGGLLPLFPSWVYGLLEVAALVAALALYWRRLPRMPFAGLVLPVVPLLLAWRSSERYFVLLPLLGLLAAVLTLSHATKVAPPGAPERRHKGAPAGIAGTPAGAD
jgi:hypothetical protein